MKIRRIFIIFGSLIIIILAIAVLNGFFKIENEGIKLPVNYVISKDGIQIAYYTIGNGPNIILVHGAMQTAKSHYDLANILAEHFTVHVYDRRGRGNSSQFNIDQYSIQNEIDDLNALISITNSEYVFGLSSGAIIVLETIQQNDKIVKAIIYEPPFSINGSFNLDWVERFNNELETGRTIDALLTGMLGTQMGPEFLNKIPRVILKLMLSGMSKENDKITGTSMYDLAPTLSFDNKIVLSTADQIENYFILQTKILLISGKNSPNYLKYSVEQLSKIIPNSVKLELEGIDHGSSGNRNQDGQPEIIGSIIIDFIKNNSVM